MFNKLGEIVAASRPTINWALTRGLVLAILTGALFVPNGFLNGWRIAYEVLLGITSPAETQVVWAAWILSGYGWLVAPAVIGGIAGHIIADRIADRATSIDSWVAEAKSRRDEINHPPQDRI